MRGIPATAVKNRNTSVCGFRRPFANVVVVGSISVNVPAMSFRSSHGCVDCYAMLFPRLPLLLPAHQAVNRSQVAFLDRIFAGLHWRQMQDGFLDVWSQVEKVHDLCHTWLGYMCQTGEFGLVMDDAFVQ